MDSPQDNEKPKSNSGDTRTKIILFIVVIIIAALGLLSALGMRGLPVNSAALYVGIPTLLALGLVALPRSRSATGAIFKGLTAALLMSAILLGEGSLCILLSAPIFYAAGALIGRSEDRRKPTAGQQGKDRGVHRTAAVATLLGLLALEGTHPSLSFNRLHTVSVTRTVPASVAAVEAKLSESPQFDEIMPLFFRLGFPDPVRATGSGLEIGDRRAVYLRDGSLYFWSDKRTDGEVVFEVVERGPGHVRFAPVQDDSAVAKWLDWISSEVRWSVRSDGMTEVTWSLGYRRKLDPVWYFGPMQRYAASLAAGVLIDSVATPDG